MRQRTKSRNDKNYKAIQPSGWFKIDNCFPVKLEISIYPYNSCQQINGMFSRKLYSTCRKRQTVLKWIQCLFKMFFNDLEFIYRYDLSSNVNRGQNQRGNFCHLMILKPSKKIWHHNIEFSIRAFQRESLRGFL